GDVLLGERPRGSGGPAGHQGLRQLAHDPAALRQRRVRRRLRHHARDVPVRRVAAAARAAHPLNSGRPRTKPRRRRAARFFCDNPSRARARSARGRDDGLPARASARAGPWRGADDRAPAR
ncbi:MAG TPA: hypothetical protein VMV45_12890, partial [Casimicrobiaceae bacterium]|nr:hypothetical protein [Casimicrobiaceae bacterium]